MRVLGLLLLWIGILVLGGSLLALAGVPMEIHILNYQLVTQSERMALAGGSLLGALVGFALWRTSKR